MAKYPDVVARIKALIRKRGLGPGDPLPSERDLSRQFKVAYGTVRMANDYLIRTGVIERQQGRGTFVAASTETEAARPESGEPATAPDAAAASMGGTARRLGLLSVEMGLYESPYLRALTFAVQRLAQEAGYELIVEQLEIEQLVEGKLPRMVRRQSVDGLFLYGRVQAHHVRFLQTQPLPLLLIGNRPVPASTPQVRINAEDLAYQITRHILKLGRRPVWFDADPSNVQYTVGQEMLAGHRRAVAEQEPGAPLHLCGLRMNRIDDAVDQMLQADLSNAAFIVQDWSASLFMLKLATRDPQRLQQLWIVPQPFEEPAQSLHGPNVVTWDGLQASEQLAAPAVKAMIDRVEGRSKVLQSVQLEFDIQVLRREPVPHMACRVTPRLWTANEQEDPSEAVHSGWCDASVFCLALPSLLSSIEAGRTWGVRASVSFVQESYAMLCRPPVWSACRRGFTLIELLVVISIISLLIAILLPALKAARESGRTIQCASSSRQLAIASGTYAADAGDYVVPWKAQANGSGSYAYCNYYMDTYLEPGRPTSPVNVVESEAWTCPSNEITPISPGRYPSQRVARRFTDNVAGAQGAAATGPNPTKRYPDAKHPSGSVIMGEHRYIDPRDSLRNYEFTNWYPDRTFYHSSSGKITNGSQNVTFGDGHVEAVDAQHQMFVLFSATMQRVWEWE